MVLSLSLRACSITSGVGPVIFISSTCGVAVASSTCCLNLMVSTGANAVELPELSAMLADSEVHFRVPHQGFRGAPNCLFEAETRCHFSRGGRMCCVQHRVGGIVALCVGRFQFLSVPAAPAIPLAVSMPRSWTPSTNPCVHFVPDRQ